MAKSKQNPLCLSGREAIAPPPEEPILRAMYELCFPWPAPETHGERELTEALIRVLGGVPEPRA